MVVRGDGLFKLDDEIIEVETLDAIRVSPEVTRAFEAGDDGLEVIVFGPRKDGDGRSPILDRLSAETAKTSSDVLRSRG